MPYQKLKLSTKVIHFYLFNEYLLNLEEEDKLLLY